MFICNWSLRKLLFVVRWIKSESLEEFSSFPVQRPRELPQSFIISSQFLFTIFGESSTMCIFAKYKNKINFRINDMNGLSLK